MSLATERRAARERALGLLYEAEAKGLTGRDVLAELPVDPDPFVAALVAAVDDHSERIDHLLRRFAEGWTLERMPALDRAALRMGTAELIARADVPTGVVLAEVVDLASRFSTDGSGRFVNGLLARVAREVRPGGQVEAVPEDQADAEVEPRPQVDALVVDLDGVIRHWDLSHHREVEQRLGLPEGSFAPIALEAGRLARATDGRLSFEDWCEEIGEAVAAVHGVPARDAADAWATCTWQVDLGVLDLLAEVRRRVPVVLLSNASSHLQRDLELSGIADAFDAVVGSADIGVAKPERGAFEAAAGSVGATLDRCLFVDDTPGHVEAARGYGMRAEVFVGQEELRDLLEQVGLMS